jgi:BASS family bile acid:Na+ symporter
MVAVTVLVGDAAAAATGGGTLRRVGALLPLGAMLLGLGMPSLAAATATMAGPLLAATTLLGVLALPGGGWNERGTLALREGLGHPLLLALALGLVAPLLAWGLAHVAQAGPGLSLWVALAAAAPAGAGAVGLATALGLHGRRTLAGVVASTAAAPLLLPAVALLLGAGGLLAPEGLAARLWLLTALPALLALPLRRCPLLTGARVRRGCAGLTVLALSFTAMGRMTGLGPLLAADPGGMLRLLGLACLPGMAGAAAVLLVQLGNRVPEALLTGGYRNVTLVWVACGAALTAEGNLLMALTALPVFATPALVALWMRLARRATPNA